MQPQMVSHIHGEGIWNSSLFSCTLWVSLFILEDHENSLVFVMVDDDS